MANSGHGKSAAGSFRIDEDKARRDAEAKMRTALNFAARSGNALGRGIRSSVTRMKGITSAVNDGFDDMLPFGVADRGKAAISAGISGLMGDNVGDAYQRHYQDRQAQERRDTIYHPVARGTGQVAGVGTQLLMPTGWLGAGARLAQKGKRVAQAAPMIAHELRAAAGVGGALGAASRGISDAIEGRLSSGRDYAASILGGMVGGRAAITGSPGRAAALEAFTTSAAGDVLNGRAPDASAALHAAANGRLLSLPAGSAISKAANRQTIKAKGHMGELASRLRTAVRGDRTVSTAKTRHYLSQGYTYPDQRTAAGVLVESKFGPTARLSRNQRRASDELGSGYRVDHLLPEDLGRITAVPGGFLGFESAEAERRSRFDQWR